MIILQQPILLASNSPRRRMLLESAGFNIRVQAVETDEQFPPTLPLDEVAGYLARLKAEASQHLLQPGEILLAADTVVIANQQIYGKPTDEADACRILRELSGQMHRVITGVCLHKPGKTKVFSAEAKVYFSDMTDEEIAFYVQQYGPYDKAGAYAIQEWVGLCKIHHIEGTYSNIMGLPVDAVYRELLNF
jgi:septum formation protein